MNWIEDIPLSYENKKFKVLKINFRNSFFDDLCNLFASGFLDISRNVKDENNNRFKIRYSEYLPSEKVLEHLFRLRQFYNVGYYESVYHYENKMIKFEYVGGRQIVRCFPVDEEYSKMGIIYIDKKEISKIINTNKENVFEYIPSIKSDNDFIMKPLSVN